LAACSRKTCARSCKHWQQEATVEIDPALLQPTSILGYLLVFVGGVLTSIGPCNLSMIPLIIGFVGGSHHLSRRRAFSISLSFTFGLSVTFMLLGVIASLVGGLLGGSTRIWYYLVAVVCFVIGLQMLGVLNLTLPSWFGSLREKVQLKGLPGAFMLGLVSGLVASQCATPVLAAILTYVMAQKAGLVYGAVLLFIYALGRGVPIVFAGTFAGVLKGLRSLGRWTEWMEKASGVIILLVGVYFLWIA
jgi:cytochrome c-type biogenesis protein